MSSGRPKSTTLFGVVAVNVLVATSTHRDQVPVWLLAQTDVGKVVNLDISSAAAAGTKSSVLVPLEE